MRVVGSVGETGSGFTAGRRPCLPGRASFPAATLLASALGDLRRLVGEHRTMSFTGDSTVWERCGVFDSGAVSSTTSIGAACSWSAFLRR